MCAMKGAIRLAAVDCSDSSNHEICRRYEVKDFPTIKVRSYTQTPTHDDTLPWAQLFSPDVQHNQQSLSHPQDYRGNPTDRLGFVQMHRREVSRRISFCKSNGSKHSISPIR